MKYPNHIRALRKGKRWIIDQAAEAMGMSRGGYIKVERGENRLTSTSIANAARAFGVKESEIVSSEDPMAKIVRKHGSNVPSVPAGQPQAPSPDDAASATEGIALKGIPRNRAQLEIFESRIVREVVEVTARKVYSSVADKLPTDDVLRVLVGFALKEYEDLKAQRLELAKVVAETQREAEDRKGDILFERDSKAR